MKYLGFVEDIQSTFDQRPEDQVVESPADRLHQEDRQDDVVEMFHPVAQVNVPRKHQTAGVSGDEKQNEGDKQYEKKGTSRWNVRGSQAAIDPLAR